MTILVAYLAALVVFLALDFVWLKVVLRPVFERYVAHLLRDRPRLGVAAGFYLFYIAVVCYFAVIPALHAGAWGIAPFHGAILGLFAYGTYEATNMATLRGWTWGMMALDIAWGAVLTAVAAGAGFFAATGL